MRFNVFLAGLNKESASQYFENAQNLRELIELIDQIIFYPEIYLYYNKIFLDEFLDELEILLAIEKIDSLNDPLHKIKCSLKELEDIKRAIDVSSNPIQLSSDFYGLWDLSTMSLYNINRDILADAAQDKHNERPNTISLILETGIDPRSNRNFFSLIIDSSHKQKYPVLYNLSRLNNYISQRYFVIANLNRTFFLSPKHGENGTGNKRGESKLLCDRIDAETLLTRAIGYKNFDERYFFDKTQEKFIIFRPNSENGVDQNTFHGYHIEKENLNQQIKYEVVRNYLLKEYGSN